MKKAVIFDFDGTIADTKNCVVKATQSAFKECGYPIPPASEIAYYMGIPIEICFPKMVKQPLTKEQFDHLLTVFRQAYKQYEVDELTMFSGIEDVLNLLHQQQIDCFVLSSKKTDVLHRNINLLNISTYFKEIIGSDKVTAYKPDPAGILAILKQESLLPEEVVMVGDATHDIIMGHAAHVETIAVLWGSHSLEQLQKENPHHIVSTPLELLNKLTNDNK